MNLLKKTKLNQSGFSLHYILPVLIIAVVTAIGVRIMTSSHAATPNNIVYTNGTGVYTVDSSGNNTLIYSKKKTANGGITNVTWANNQSEIFWGFKTYTTPAQAKKPAQIYSMTYAGKKVKDITSKDTLPAGAQLSNLWWSEAAQKLLFTLDSYSAGSSTPVSYVYTMNGDGSGLKLIYSPGSNGGVDAAYWSPNGQKIFIGTFSLVAPWYGGSLNVVNTDGTGMITLPHTSLDAHGNQLVYAGNNPWSSDSSNLVLADEVISNNQSVTAIMTEPADGSKAPQVLSLVTSSLHFNTVNDGPQWSPDGKTIVYCGNVALGNSAYQCYKIALTAANQISPQTSQLVGGQVSGGFRNGFDFSPDSSQIAYSPYVGTNAFPLYTLNLSNGLATNLNIVNTANNYEWSIQ